MRLIGMASSNGSGMLTTREVAERLHVSMDTVARLVKAGALPAARIGLRQLRFRAEDVEAYIRARAVGDTAGSRGKMVAVVVAVIGEGRRGLRLRPINDTEGIEIYMPIDDDAPLPEVGRIVTVKL